MHFLCYHINAEARTTQQRAALRRLYLFLGYSLHAGYSIISYVTWEFLNFPVSLTGYLCGHETDQNINANSFKPYNSKQNAIEFCTILFKDLRLYCTYSVWSLNMIGMYSSTGIICFSGSPAINFCAPDRRKMYARVQYEYLAQTRFFVPSTLSS